MDYKDIVEVMKWHSMYSELNGAEARVMMFMASTANYKTSKLSASYNELADELSLSKVSISKAIASLVLKKAIAIDDVAIGRMQATYKIRNANELTEYFEIEKSNSECDAWMNEEERLFGTLLSKIGDVGEGCAECDLDHGKYCFSHAIQIKHIKDTQEHREYKMWRSDNPSPAYRIKTIHGKIVK